MKKQLSKSEIKELNEKIKDGFGIGDFFGKKEKVEIVEDEYKLIVKDGEALFVYHEERIMPTLRMLLKKDLLKKVVVDMGAVKFVSSGADIMRPGINEIEEGASKDEFAVIVDETHGKPLAVGILMHDGEEIMLMESGKAVKNIHYIGDKIWSIKF